MDETPTPDSTAHGSGGRVGLRQQRPSTHQGRSPGLARSPLTVGPVIIVLMAVAVVGTWVHPAVGAVLLGLIVIAWIGRVLEFGVALLGFYAAALYLVPSRFTTGPFAMTAAMMVGFVVALSWGAGKLTRAPRLASGLRPIPLAIGAYVVVVLASYAALQLRFPSAIEASEADRRAAALIVLVAVALLAADALRTRGQMESVLTAIVAASSGMAIFGVIQFVFGVNFWHDVAIPGFSTDGTPGFIYSRQGFRRVAGTTRHPIEFGVVCAVTLPLALHLLRYGSTLARRRLGGAAAILLAAGVPLALSRAAVLALAVVAVVLVPLWTWRQRVVTAGGALGLAIAITLSYPGLFTSLGGLFTEEDASIRGRTAALEEAIPLGEANPWLGQGFGTWVPQERFVVDNQYIILLLETGYTGLTAMVVLLAVAVMIGFRAWNRHRDAAARDLAASLVATIGGIGIAGFGLNTLRFPVVAGTLFLAFGLVTALERQVAQDAAVRPGEAMQGGRILVLGVAGGPDTGDARQSYTRRDAERTVELGT